MQKCNLEEETVAHDLLIDSTLGFPGTEVTHIQEDPIKCILGFIEETRLFELEN